MTPEHLEQLRLEAWGPGIVDDMVALFEHIESQQKEIEKLKAGHFDVTLDIAKERDSLREELKKFKSFAKDIRNGYDCDTGANGVHHPHCRCCTAEELLGLPPHPARDQRTRGG